MGILEFVIIVLVLYGIFKLLSRTVERRDSKYPQDDTQTIQQLNRTTSRMEKRIEALETILMDKIEKKNDSETESDSTPFARSNL